MSKVPVTIKVDMSFDGETRDGRYQINGMSANVATFTDGRQPDMAVSPNGAVPAEAVLAHLRLMADQFTWLADKLESRMKGPGAPATN